MTKMAYHHGDLRHALLAAAEAELAEKGLEGFTLRGCAKRAGVSHAAPAHHFKDADELLTALAVGGFQRFTSAMRDRQRLADLNPRAQLTAAGMAYVEFATANRPLFNLMFGSQRPDTKDAALAASKEEAFGVLVEAVSTLRGDTAMANEPGRRDVAACWATVHGIATLLMAGHLDFLNPAGQRDDMLRGLIERSMP
jgi:AcrR family transcriptional regulator